ncbi:hypothetical protein OEA23_07265 [Paenibacillus polysaccharolyticus]
MIGRFGGGPIDMTANEGLVLAFLISPSIVIIFETGSILAGITYLFLVCGGSVLYNCVKQSKSRKSFDYFSSRIKELELMKFQFISDSKQRRIENYRVQKIVYIGDTVEIHYTDLDKTGKVKSSDMKISITRQNFVSIKTYTTQILIEFESKQIRFDSDFQNDETN